MRKRILLIEDDLAQRRMMQAALEQARLAVASAAGGQQGLAYAELGSVDLIILDIGLSGLMDGFEVLACLKDSPLTAHIPVVMVSARDGNEWLAQGMAGGAASCVTKPFDMDHLLSQVRTLLAATDMLPASANGITHNFDGSAAI